LFMTDNGPQQPRYNGGMLRLKGTVNEGGIRVPFFVRWPGRFEAGRKVDRIAAHIDVTPTLLEICDVATPAGAKFDGRSLEPLLAGQDADWTDRTLFFQWHRGDIPELGRAFAARSQHYKLVQWGGVAERSPLPQGPPQLFDMTADPFEERDVAAAHPEIVDSLRREYERWFRDVTGTREYSDAGVARIFIGDSREDPVRLTRQDWRGPLAGWTPQSVGHWEVDVRHPGPYQLTMRFAELTEPAVLTFVLGAMKQQKDVPAGASKASFSGVRLSPGRGTLASSIIQGERTTGVIDVVVSRRNH
jgi:hypothetical protein